jgi:hypothetical protein
MPSKLLTQPPGRARPRRYRGFSSATAREVNAARLEWTDWGWQQQLDPWLKLRIELPVGALFCVISGPTAGRPWSAAAARTQFRRWPSEPVSVVASRRISCVTPMPLKWRERASL